MDANTSPRGVLIDAVSNGPVWARIVVAVLLVLAGVVGHRCTQTTPQPQQPVNLTVQPATPNVTVQAPAPTPASTTTAKPRTCCRAEGKCCPTVCVCDGICVCEDCQERTAAANREKLRIHPAHRIAAEHWRNRVSAQLQKDGFALAGGDKKPIPAELADKLAAKLSDVTIIEGARSIGAIGDGEPGPILSFIQRLFQWIADHPEQVAAFIKFLLSLLMFISAETGIPIDVLLVMMGLN